jgi:hypothetical protein
MWCVDHTDVIQTINVDQQLLIHASIWNAIAHMKLANSYDVTKEH